MKPPTTKTVTFQVQIPNLDGDGIAETLPIEVQAYDDPETGEEVLTPESLELIEKTQARHMGLMSPEEIKGLRQRLEVTQQEISDLLQVGEKTYTRWENGRSRPSRSMNLLLCALRDGWLNVNYLRFLRNPHLKTEWLSWMSDRKNIFALADDCILVSSDDFASRQTANFRQWFAHVGTLLQGMAPNPMNWQRVYISHYGEKDSPGSRTRTSHRSTSSGGLPHITQLGRQTRTPHPILNTPDEELFG